MKKPLPIAEAGSKTHLSEVVFTNLHAVGLIDPDDPIDVVFAVDEEIFIFPLFI